MVKRAFPQTTSAAGLALGLPALAVVENSRDNKVANKAGKTGFNAGLVAKELLQNILNYLVLNL